MKSWNLLLSLMLCCFLWVGFGLIGCGGGSGGGGENPKKAGVCDDYCSWADSCEAMDPGETIASCVDWCIDEPLNDECIECADNCFENDNCDDIFDCLENNCSSCDNDDTPDFVECTTCTVECDVSKLEDEILCSLLDGLVKVACLQNTLNVYSACLDDCGHPCE